MDIILDLDRRQIRDAVGVPIGRLPLKRGDQVTWRVRIATTEDVDLVGGEVVFAAAYLEQGKTNLIHKTATIGSDGSASIVPQSHTDGLDAAIGAGTDTPKTSIVLDGEFRVTATTGMTIATYNIPVAYMWGIAADIDDPDNLESTTLQIGTVETLPAGASATASISYASGVYSLNLGIPQGAKGDPGEAELPTNAITTDNIASHAVTSLGGVSGAITLGDGLSMAGTVLSASGGGDLPGDVLTTSNIGSYAVTAIAGATGDVTLGSQLKMTSGTLDTVRTIPTLPSGTILTNSNVGTYAVKTLGGKSGAITLGSGLSMSGQTLSASGGGGGSVDWSAISLASTLNIQGPNGEQVLKYEPGVGLQLGGEPTGAHPFTEAVTIKGYTLGVSMVGAVTMTGGSPGAGNQADYSTLTLQGHNGNCETVIISGPSATNSIIKFTPSNYQVHLEASGGVYVNGNPIS